MVIGSTVARDVAVERRPPFDIDGWLAVERLTGRTTCASGFIDGPGGRIWWMRVGEGSGPPLLVLHGGPGSGHDGLLPLATLAVGRSVVFYDQLGCGRSDAPEDPQIYTIQRSVDELDAVRGQLGLNYFDLFGQSWGSVLAIEYLCQGRGAGVRKVVLSGAVSSMPRFAAGARSLFESIRQKMAQTSSGEPDQDALNETFSERHFCRAYPEPAHVGRSKANLKASIAYREMNGPNEYTVTGVVRDWDRTRDLGLIRVPVLVTTGEHDEVVPEVTSAVASGIIGARLASFTGCSHLVIAEDPPGYLREVRAFLG